MNKENRLLIAKNHAESLGGTCLSDTYLGVDYKILWKCSNPEHPSWQATYYSVVVNKSWCLKCAYKIKGDKKRNNNGLKEAQEYAKKEMVYVYLQNTKMRELNLNGSVITLNINLGKPAMIVQLMVKLGVMNAQIFITKNIKLEKFWNIY